MTQTTELSLNVEQLLAKISKQMNMPIDEAAGLILEDEWVVVPNALLRKSAWKTVRTGQIKHAPVVPIRLKESKASCSKVAHEIIQAITFLDNGFECTLALLNVKDLSLYGDVGLQQIYDAADRYGLATGPAELAIELACDTQLRLPHGTTLNLAMSPLRGLDGNQYILQVRETIYGRKLLARAASLPHTFSETSRFIFVKRTKRQSV